MADAMTIEAEEDHPPIWWPFAFTLIIRLTAANKPTGERHVNIRKLRLNPQQWNEYNDYQRQQGMDTPARTRNPTLLGHPVERRDYSPAERAILHSIRGRP